MKPKQSSPLAVDTFFIRWQVLYFVNAIKIFISFPTSVLVISHSVAILLGYNRITGSGIR